MEQLFTRLRIKRKLGALGGFLAFFLILLGNSAQAQYCESNLHTYVCGAYPPYHYGSIGQVRISQGTNVLYNKANDACNGGTGGFSLITTAPAFTLTAGSTYKLEHNTQSYYCCGYTGNGGAWIDLNRDGDFSDAGECLGTWSGVPEQPTLGSRNLTIPCTGVNPGTTRLRIRNSYSYTYSTTDACTNKYYGETEDYTITLANSTSLQANFSAPTTSYTGTIVNFLNANATGYFYHGWDLNDDGTIESNNTNYSYIPNTPGTYSIRLISQNCLGRDSIAKNFTVANPTSAPVADFIAGNNNYQQYDFLQLYDLSTNGATSWEWMVFDPADSAGTLQTVTGTNPYSHMNPTFNMGIPGDYKVCLQTSNMVGSSGWVCKPGYVKVNAPSDINMGPVTSTMAATGNLFDNGGPNAAYGNNRFDYLAIKPCGATNVKIRFSQFKLGAGDNLQIYDGTSAGGAALHPAGGWTSSNPLPRFTDIVANSGAMYILFQSNASGTDSGFKATWTATMAPPTPPVAGFITPDTIYNSVVTKVFNTSSNIKGDVNYEWSIDGIPMSSTTDYNAAWLTDGLYALTLTVTTCAGSDSYTDSILVKTPDSRTNLDFIADNRRPSSGNIVKFTTSSDKANQFRWTVYPNTTAVFVNGTSASSKEPQIRFNAPGAYTLTLRAWNHLDSAKTVRTLIKDDYIIVTNYCQPFVAVATSQDVGISNVTISKGSTTLLNNTTATGAAGYNNYTSSQMATLTFGATYNISISRQTNVNPMTRKVWIDFNIDGDFNDAGELIVNEAVGTSMTYNGTFTVPDISSSFTGSTIMRVAVSYNNMANTACGPNPVGEFEDYGIVLINDGSAPVLALNGEDTMYVEVGSTFSDPGATATDATEGDISSKIQILSDLDAGNTGIYTIVYSVRDASGNEAPSLTRVVYVVADRTPPTLALVGSDTVYIEALVDTYTELGATATDAKDGDLTSAIVKSGSVNDDVIGTYVVVYEVADAQGNTAKRTRVIRVRDTQAPMIYAVGSDNVQIGSAFFDQTYAEDKYDGIIALVKTGATVNPLVPGIYTVTYNATDASGNPATPVVRNYRVDDFTLPVINLNTPDTIFIAVNPATPYKGIEPTVSDAYYSADVITLSKVSNVNAYVLGTYTEVYTATDPSNNVSSKTRFVKVIDNEAPVLYANTISVKRYSNFNPMSGIVVKDNYYSPVILTPLIKVLDHNVNIYEVGVYSITYQVTDPSGNESAPYTRYVIVTEDGTINGVKDVVNNTFRAYPNPSNGVVNLEFFATLGNNASIEVMDATGKVVMNVDAKATFNNKLSLDLSNVAAGVYFIKVIDNNKQTIEKVSILK